ncbi:formin-like protein 2 [Ziziphus jujuba]|uniref:Formin-like protein 2 n=1 Tax=Ziziphus jujuba TaxID=326968 RepID=A0ABM3IPG0_ZIZJJ|nr:formin-like protein 2 [Ziziphus jujuba]
MAGYGWNLRHGNVQGLNRGRQQLPHNPSQIACRLCDQVFLSTQALINHIETHMVEDEAKAASRRQQKQQEEQQQQTNFMSTQRDLFAVNPFRPAFPSPTPVPTLPPSTLKAQTFFPVQFSSPLPIVPQIVNSQPLILPPPTPPPVSPLMRNNMMTVGTPVMTPIMTFVPPPMQQRRSVAIEEINASDYTKPLLSLLERPIQKPSEVVEKANGIVLDLTLKL